MKSIISKFFKKNKNTLEKASALWQAKSNLVTSDDENMLPEYLDDSVVSDVFDRYRVYMSEESISERAYLLWEEDGCNNDDQKHYWDKAKELQYKEYVIK